MWFFINMKKITEQHKAIFYSDRSIIIIIIIIFYSFYKESNLLNMVKYKQNQTDKYKLHRQIIIKFQSSILRTVLKKESLIVSWLLEIQKCVF